MARVLIVAGGCRGRELGRRLMGDGHAVRITTRTEAGRPLIEAIGGECWIGTPDRIGSLRYALENTTVVCWLLGTASGPAAQVAALHGSRLDFMLSQTIDTTVRGFVYEAAGTVAVDALAGGAATVRRQAERNEIPYRLLGTHPGDEAAWAADADQALAWLLRTGGTAALH